MSCLTTLQNKIKISSNYAFYIDCKNKLINITKEVGNGDNIDVEFVNKIIELIKTPEQLVTKDFYERLEFIKSEDSNHTALGSIHSLIRTLDLLESKNQKVNNIIQDLKKGYKDSVDLLIERVKSINRGSKEKIFETRPIIMCESDFQFRDISIDFAYRITSYDDALNDYVKKNSAGNSRVSCVDNVFYKISISELTPLIEYGVFQFYSLLFGQDQKLISPTQMLVITRLPILPPRSKLKKELNNLLNSPVNSTENINFKLKELKEQIQNEKDLESPIIVQANLAQDGISIKDLLDDIKEKTNKEVKDQSIYNSVYFKNLKESICIKSFGSHVLSSILLVHTDYHQENLIYNKTTKEIIGIDNDRAFESDVFVKNVYGHVRLRFKNILFTFDSLMAEPIDTQVIDKFINKDPHCFIFEWLQYLYEKEKVYFELIEKAIPLNYPDREKVVQNYNKDQLSIPFHVEYEFIDGLLYKFSKMVKLLKEKRGIITHQQIFKEILPSVKLLYDKVSQRLPDDQLLNVFLETKSNDLIKKIQDSGIDLNLDSPKSAPITITELIIKFISNFNANDLINNQQPNSFLSLLKLIFKYYQSKQQKEQQKIQQEQQELQHLREEIQQLQQHEQQQLQQHQEEVQQMLQEHHQEIQQLLQLQHQELHQLQQLSLQQHQLQIQELQQELQQSQLQCQPKLQLLQQQLQKEQILQLPQLQQEQLLLLQEFQVIQQELQQEEQLLQLQHELDQELQQKQQQLQQQKQQELHQKYQQEQQELHQKLQKRHQKQQQLLQQQELILQKEQKLQDLFFYLEKQPQLNQSWYNYIQDILLFIVKYQEIELIENTIIMLLNILNIKSSQLDLDKDSQPKSIIQLVFTNVNNKDKITTSIKILKEFGATLDILDKWSSLDVVTEHTEFGNKEKIYYIKYLIEDLGASKANPEIFSRFYLSLSESEKEEISNTIIKLGERDPETTWRLALDSLIPINNSNKDNLIFFPDGETRYISPEYLNELYDPVKSFPKKSDDQLGTRSVPSIRNGIHKLYFKFSPQFVGNDIAVSNLAHCLFGYCTPYSKFGVFRNIPILITQEIKGRTLNDIVVNNESSIISNLDPSSVSKIIILEILINNADGNLGNYIINSTLNCNKNIVHKIFSIDNDQVFMPATTKEIKRKGIWGKKTNSLQVETVIFFLEQMNSPIHKDIVESFKNRDMGNVLKKWIEDLKTEHYKWVDFFCNKEHNKYSYIDFEELKKDQCIIGIAFIPGQLRKLYGKILTLQNLLKKDNITHWNVLEYLEPSLASKYKAIINNSAPKSTLIDKFSKLRNGGSVTSSSYTTIDICDSMEVESEEIQNNLLNGKYGPIQAQKELEDSLEKHTDIEGILNSLNNLNDSFFGNLYYNYYNYYNNSNKPTLSKELVEKVLKHFKLSTLTKAQENHLLDLVSEKELTIIKIMQSNSLNINRIKEFKLDKIVSLSIIECPQVISLSNNNNYLIFIHLKKLKLIDCINLSVIKIKSPLLDCLIAPGCIGLKKFEVEAPLLKRIDFHEGSVTDVQIENYLKNNFESLIELNISKNKISNIEDFFVGHLICDPDLNTKRIKSCINIMVVDGGKYNLAFKVLQAKERDQPNPIEYYTNVNQNVSLRISYFYNTLNLSSMDTLSSNNQYYQSILIFDPSNYSYNTLERTYNLITSVNLRIRNTSSILVPIYSLDKRSNINLDIALKFIDDHPNCTLLKLCSNLPDEFAQILDLKSCIFKYINDNYNLFERRLNVLKNKNK